MPTTRMATVDAAWLHMDEPDNRMVITAVMEVGGTLPTEALAEVLQQRLVETWPRFRQRIETGTLGEARWVDDEAFDLRAHLRRIGVPRPGGRAGLQALVSEIMSRPLDPARPPWELTLVDLWDDPEEGTAIIARIHHAVADGISLARVLLSLADAPPAEAAEDDPLDRSHDEGVSVEASAGTLPGRLQAWLRAGADAGERWIERGLRASEDNLERVGEGVISAARLGSGSAAAAGRLLALTDDPPTLLRGPLQPQKAVAWSDGTELERIKRIARGLGGTVNDVLLTALAAALGRLLRDHGDEQVDEVRTLVPVNLRPLDRPVPRELGNRFGLVFLELPVAHQPPRERFIALKRRMDRLKQSTEPVLTHALLSAVGLTPVQVERLVVDVFGAKASLITTNVPGPREPLTLAGQSVRRVLFWVPQAANVSLGVSLFSYAGRVVWGVSSDRGRLEDPGELVRGIEAALDELEGCLQPA